MLTNHHRTILHGVPNNTQLALSLLRQAEKQNRPLPPPPTQPSEEVSNEPVPLTSDILSASGNDSPLGASPEELLQASALDHELLDQTGGNDTEISETNSKEPHRVLTLAKGAAKLGVRAAVALDKTRAKLGHPGAKNRLGVVPSKNVVSIPGPVKFEAYYEGESGCLTISTNGSGPSSSSIGFHSTKKKNTLVWSFPISEITALRKYSGYGFKSKLAAGWALDKKLSDSLGIEDGKGKEWIVTAIPCRDALFNRLLSIGEQNWEVT
jgi:hypothetical protein